MSENRTYEDLSIEFYSSSFLPAMQKLEKICFPPDQAFDRRTLLHFMNDYDSVTLCMNRSADNMIGFLIFSEVDSAIWELMTIEIDPAERGKGFGFLLLSEGMAEVETRKPKAIVLHVSTENKPAIELYRKFGFHIVKSVRNYYNGGQSAFLMQKEFL